MSFVQTSDQTVFGEGPKRAAMMLIGEQPRLRKDVAETIVGPAGKIMDRALADAGIDPIARLREQRGEHFKWEPRGDCIQKPELARNQHASWLEAELRIVKPNLVVAMGARQRHKPFFGSDVTRERGKSVVVEVGAKGARTVHPSSLLRQPKNREHPVADLRRCRRLPGGTQNALMSSELETLRRYLRALPGFLDSARNDDLLIPAVSRSLVFVPMLFET